GRESPDIARIGRRGASVHNPSACLPRAPGAACTTRVECTWWLSASFSTSAPIDPHAIRRFSSTRSTTSPLLRPRLSDVYGPSLTPPRRVVNTTSYESADQPVPGDPSSVRGGGIG